MTAEQLSTLEDELRADPLERYYDTEGELLQDEILFSRLTAVDRQTRLPVPRWELKQLLYLSGVWPALKQACENTDPTLAGTAATCVAFLSDGDFETIDLDMAGVSQMFDVLVAYGVLTAELKAQAFALGDATQTRASELGLTGLRLRDVIRTRRLIHG